MQYFASVQKAIWFAKDPVFAYGDSTGLVPISSPRLPVEWAERSDALDAKAPERSDDLTAWAALRKAYAYGDGGTAITILREFYAAWSPLDLTPSMLQDALIDYAPATVRKYRSVLVKAYDVWLDAGTIAYNPARFVEVAAYVGTDLAALDTDAATDATDKYALIGALSRDGFKLVEIERITVAATRKARRIGKIYLDGKYRVVSDSTWDLVKIARRGAANSDPLVKFPNSRNNIAKAVRARWNGKSPRDLVNMFYADVLTQCDGPADGYSTLVKMTGIKSGAKVQIERFDW